MTDCIDIKAFYIAGGIFGLCMFFIGAGFGVTLGQSIYESARERVRKEAGKGSEGQG